MYLRNNNNNREIRLTFHELFVIYENIISKLMSKIKHAEVS